MRANEDKTEKPSDDRDVVNRNLGYAYPVPTELPIGFRMLLDRLARIPRRPDNRTDDNV